jgi:hypothetical protein
MPNQVTKGTAQAGRVVAQKLSITGGTERNEKWVKVPLAAVATAGGVLAWQNPEGTPIMVTRLILDVTTPATGACTLDAGTAADGTTSNDGLLDGVDVGTAAGVFDNLGNAGSNGRARQRLAAGSYVTVSQASGAVAGLVGSALIAYVVL